MVRDKTGSMFSSLRVKCRECKGCDRFELEVALCIIAYSKSLRDLVGAIPRGAGSADAYYVEVKRAAHVHFVWRAPYASDLELICRG
jgi:hypothetical protein